MKKSILKISSLIFVCTLLSSCEIEELSDSEITGPFRLVSTIYENEPQNNNIVSEGCNYFVAILTIGAEVNGDIITKLDRDCDGIFDVVANGTYRIFRFKEDGTPAVSDDTVAYERMITTMEITEGTLIPGEYPSIMGFTAGRVIKVNDEQVIFGTEDHSVLIIYERVKL